MKIKFKIKSTLKNMRALCRAFPINIHINRINDNTVIMYFFYLAFLPAELVWGGYRYLLGRINNKNSDYKYEYSIVSIVKNEGPYLDEWISYHLSVIGIQHFYLFNNNSTDNTRKLLEKYERAGIVTCIELKGNQRQVDAYNLSIQKYWRESRFLVVIDADEFIQITGKEKRLKDVIGPLLNQNNVGGVGLNWCMYGSSGEIHYKKELVTIRFTHRAELHNSSNYYIKSVINPRYTIGFFSAHAPNYWFGYKALNCVGEIIYGSLTNEVEHKPVRLNHYFTKSKEEFLKKRARGMADQKGIRDENNFKQYDLNNEEDTSMCQYRDIILKTIQKYNQA